MSEELKPCPFCGGPGYLCQIPSASGGDRYIWIAKCSTDDGCGVEFLGTSRKVDAIKEWNRRVDNDLTAKLKLAVEALEHYGNPDTYSDGFHKFGCDAPNIASDALKQIGEQL